MCGLTRTNQKNLEKKAEDGVFILRASRDVLSRDSCGSRCGGL